MLKDRQTKFRQLITEKGTLILAGKDAENNEELVKQIESNEDVFHTALPGSPFLNIKNGNKKPLPGDVKTATLFCASKSQDWRDNKKDVVIHRFKGKDIYKIKGMKTGTFGIKKHKAIKIKKEDIENFINSFNKD